MAALDRGGLLRDGKEENTKVSGECLSSISSNSGIEIGILFRNADQYYFELPSNITMFIGRSATLHVSASFMGHHQAYKCISRTQVCM
jgi:hypothetical protein